jgi:sulfite exporter TauE/SafE
MVTATVAFERIARLLSSRATLRNVAGALLLAFGLYTAGSALMKLRPAPPQAEQQQGHEHMHH